MILSGTLLENLPFPYFFIDHQFRILAASTPFGTNCHDQIFTLLMDKNEVRRFESDLFLKNTMEVNLNINNHRNLYRIYKMEGEDNNFHLFCYPVEKEIDPANNKSKLNPLHFIEQMIDNEKIIDHSKQEIHEASIHSEYITNISKLAAGIAHEIRNPLTTVKGFIQLLKPYLIEIGKEQYAEIALEEINRANDLIYEFLNSTKPQENKKSEISLNKIVKDIAILYESEGLLKNIQINVQLSDQSPVVMANGKQLKQVLVNIIKNAIEAITIKKNNEYGLVQLSVEVIEASAYIIIEDNGCGMTEETMRHLFLPFYSTKETGTGIGLPICKKIIEDHEGNLYISSTLGKGTIFKLELPLFL
ncbi:GHKL domain-containing protein [Bacillus sp. FJAT-49705]|uniref:histidine kinase n=1 Tax=Cytobacillus citreus TaxID=2833586 RepID=A0ABS5NNP0_9BACI|nr:ATP-binding protein [Cytobacillus citreus]MBS4189422.1 GHKL domain-containing protein [Cytobacillus citreus]